MFPRFTISILLASISAICAEASLNFYILGFCPPVPVLDQSHCPGRQLLAGQKHFRFDSHQCGNKKNKLA
jgi:hypothetical protein